MVDWNKYRDFFPERYIKSGYFDEYLLKIEGVLNILDIGGGINGTEVLNKPNFTVDLLDPFIEKKPDWMNEKVNWSTNKIYDLVICRGSLNYLTIDELNSIKSLLVSGGRFIANTFLNHPPDEWISRFYGTVSGLKGNERFRFNCEKSIIEHELIPEYGESIFHSFFYYSREFYEKMFPGVEFIEHKENSIILNWNKD